MPVYSELIKLIVQLCASSNSYSAVCLPAWDDHRPIMLVSLAKGNKRVQRNHMWSRLRSHQHLLTCESGLQLFLWAFQKYVSVVGDTGLVGYLWVEREQRRNEEKSNLLGRNHLQLRLEEFWGKVIFFPGQWNWHHLSHAAACQYLSLKPGKKIQHCYTAKLQGLFNSRP